MIRRVGWRWQKAQIFLCVFVVDDEDGVIGRVGWETKKAQMLLCVLLMKLG